MCIRNPPQAAARTSVVEGRRDPDAALTDHDAQELVRFGKAGQLVAGFRGAPPADESALVDLLLRLSQLAYDLPEVAELDLNPVLALGNGCLAVDARIRIADPARPHRSKSW